MLGVDGVIPLPFLFVEDEAGTVNWQREALVYARASLQAYDIPTIERDIDTIGRFCDFYIIFWNGMPLPDNEIDYLIYAYLIWRHNGNISHGASRLGGLRWKSLAFDALRAEFKSLVRYFRFASLTWGYVSLGRLQQAVDVRSPSLKRLRTAAELKERDFLVHLNGAREYWNRLYGPEIAMPPVAIGVRSNGSSIRSVMPEEDIWSIIENERNPVFRALWLVGAFGGLRISEQLQAWQIDVLPGSARRLLLGYDGIDDDILFLRADPIASRYIGDVGKPGATRRQFLRERYSMTPRKELSRRHPLYAGWKETLYLNREMLLSEVFWLHGRAANLFAECAGEIREFHRLHETSKRHPFFYVNIADLTRELRGDILKKSNVEAAWDGACRRCGLEPHRWGRNLHGLRHFYKACADSLTISRDDLQIMMGHRRLNSQDDYGRVGRKVATGLGEARQQHDRGLLRIETPA